MTWIWIVVVFVIIFACYWFADFLRDSHSKHTRKQIEEYEAENKWDRWAEYKVRYKNAKKHTLVSWVCFAVSVIVVYFVKDNLAYIEGVSWLDIIPVALFIVSAILTEIAFDRADRIISMYEYKERTTDKHE